MTQTIYWCLGLPASGKSTKAKEMVDKSQGKLKRVNKDDLRALLDNYDFSKSFSKANEAFVLKVRDTIIMEALMEGLSVIVDDTNFGDKHPLRFAQLAAEYTTNTMKKCEVVKLDFTDVPVQECIKRDALRGSKSVGEQVILRMYNQFLKKPLPTYVPPVQGLPKVVICDLDGTLALLNGRNPYDASTADKDEINKPVLMVLQALFMDDAVKKIIFFSGREDQYREPTLRFLEKCGFSFLTDTEGNPVSHNCELYMRKTGDQRKDSIIKRELFDAHIQGKYDPVLWLDDREQVCQMVRHDLGVPLFQVAEGNF